MRILLFGGTTEGRELAAALSGEGHCVTVCVATALGAEELAGIPGITVQAGRLPPEEIRAMLPDYDLCVDATHPYAERISRTLETVCRETGIPLRRVLRAGKLPASQAPEGADRETDRGVLLHFPSQQAAADYLTGTEGRILLTTGAKELSSYRAIDPKRLFVRILPTHGGLDACEQLGIPHRNIIAMQGPFSTELNTALLRQFGIRFLVTKDGGAAGGFPEKLAAAESLDVTVLVIARPEEKGISAEELLRELKKTASPKSIGCRACSDRQLTSANVFSMARAKRSHASFSSYPSEEKLHGRQI